MFEILLNYIYDYLTITMSVMLVVGLVFRWLIYKSSKYDKSYFLTFSQEIEKFIENDKNRGEAVQDVEPYINNLIEKVTVNLPVRSLRFYGKQETRKDNKFGAKDVISMRDYVSGKRTLMHGIRSEVSAFKSSFPPNYSELTTRILEKDQHWVKLFGVFPIDKVIRMIDILPRIFVVLGIFGTFIGISMALPEISKINFENLKESGAILTNFVLHVTFSMKTSVLGIFFSLILTVLNSLYPVTKMRKFIVKKVENSFEYLWLSLHGQTDVMPEILSSLRRLEAIAEEWTKENSHKKKAS